MLGHRPWKVSNWTRTLKIHTKIQFVIKPYKTFHEICLHKQKIMAKFMEVFMLYKRIEQKKIMARGGIINYRELTCHRTVVLGRWCRSSKPLLNKKTNSTIAKQENKFIHCLNKKTNLSIAKQEKKFIHYFLSLQTFYFVLHIKIQ